MCSLRGGSSSMLVSHLCAYSQSETAVLASCRSSWQSRSSQLHARCGVSVKEARVLHACAHYLLPGFPMPPGKLLLDLQLDFAATEAARSSGELCEIVLAEVTCRGYGCSCESTCTQSCCNTEHTNWPGHNKFSTLVASLVAIGDQHA